MDVDVALANARNLALEVHQAIEGAGDLIKAADELADTFQALDEWLTKGGFLPADWSRSA